MSCNIHIKMLVENLIVDIIRGFYTNFQEFVPSYVAKNDEKLEQLV